MKSDRKLITQMILDQIYYVQGVRGQWESMLYLELNFLVLQDLRHNAHTTLAPRYTLQFSQYLNKRARQIKSNTEIVMKHVFQFSEIVFNVIHVCAGEHFSTLFVVFIFLLHFIHAGIKFENVLMCSAVLLPRHVFRLE